MLIDNKLLLFGGKGGVGKTSCAAATALYVASKGKKTLILSTDPAHSLSDSFGIEIGNKITKIKENLEALEIDSGELLKDYKEKYGDIIKQIADEGTFFSKQEIQEFFDLSLPGMDELMALIKIIDLLEENKHGLLILDTAPTGHTIRLLEMPELMTSYVKVLAEMRQKHRVVVRMMVGRYVKDKADEFIEKMQDNIKKVKETLKSEETRFIPITIPEAMSVYETERLMKVLENHNIKVDEILINRVIKDNCDFCKSKKQEQEKYIGKIKKFGYKTRQIPLFANEIKGKDLEILAKILAGEKYKQEHNPNFIEIYNKDSRNLRDIDKVDFIITSLPAFNFDFSRCFSIYFWWLNFSNTFDNAEKKSKQLSLFSIPKTLQKKKEVFDIKKLDRLMIGTKKINNKLIKLNIDFADKLVNEIGEKKNCVGIALSKYYYDIKLVLTQLHKLLKEGKYCCIKISDCVLYGNSIRCPDTIIELAKQVGFKLDKRIKRIIPKKVLIFAKEDKMEEFLIFKK